MRRFCVTVGIVSLGILGHTCWGAASIIDLGPLSGQECGAFGLNDLGQVVGSSGDRGFLWLPEDAYGLPAGMNDLGTLGGSKITARDINNSGRIVGSSEIGLGMVKHGFVWLPQADPPLLAGMNDLPSTLYWSLGYGINEDGATAGEDQFWAWDYACGWDRYGRRFGTGSLAPPGSSYDWGAAYDINDANQIVGYSQISGYGGPEHAFLWTPGGTGGVQHNPALRDLGAGRAYGINNRGQAVGTFGLWQDGVITSLGGPAHAINDAGQAVGVSSTGAFCWDKGTFLDLNILLPPNSQWDFLEEARDINALGQIVGTGLMSGERHAFLLTIPEPGTLLLGLLSALALLHHTRNDGRRNCAASTD